MITKDFFFFPFFPINLKKKNCLKSEENHQTFKTTKLKTKINFFKKNDEDVKYKLMKTLEVHCVFKYKVGLKPIGI